MVALVLLGVAVTAVVRLRALGEAAVLESDAALAAFDLPTAISRARDAAMATAPGSPYPEEGYARLLTIANDAEAHGSIDVATLAWRATWTAVRSTRSEARLASRQADAGNALVRLAARACEGGTRLPAECGRAARSLLLEAPLPPLARLTWLAFGTVAFLGGGARAAGAKNRSRTLWVFVTMAGVAVATAALLER